MAHWTKSIHAASNGYAREMAKRRAFHVTLGRGAKAAAAVAGTGAAVSAGTSGPVAAGTAAAVSAGASGAVAASTGVSASAGTSGAAVAGALVGGAGASWMVPVCVGVLAVGAIGVLIWSARQRRAEPPSPDVGA
jgi:hypothetical protein